MEHLNRYTYNEISQFWGVVGILALFAIVVGTSLPHEIKKTKLEKIMGVPVGTAMVSIVAKRVSGKEDRWYLRSLISQSDRRHNWAWHREYRHQSIKSGKDYR